jgi:predicted DNA-binding ribbon-helix-helix protein
VSKRSITIAGHRTSISLEAPFWEALAEIAASRKTSVAALVADIDRGRGDETNLSAALRMYALDWYRRPSVSAARPRAGS